MGVTHWENKIYFIFCIVLNFIVMDPLLVTVMGLQCACVSASVLVTETALIFHFYLLCGGKMVQRGTMKGNHNLPIVIASMLNYPMRIVQGILPGKLPGNCRVTLV